MTARGPSRPVYGAGPPEPETAAGAEPGQEHREPASRPPWADVPDPEPPTWVWTSAGPGVPDATTSAGAGTYGYTGASADAVTHRYVRTPADDGASGYPGTAAGDGASGYPGASVDGGPPRTEPTGRSLSVRLTALARLIQIAAVRAGGGGFSEKLLQTAEDLLNQAGERLRLSAEHTVVALSGGTGSGKSTLFNKVAGADFSAVGVTRPVTRDAHACVWGTSGSGPLLEWLGVPRRFRYARASALDTGEAALNGLVLLDLPDHDSVVVGATHQVDRLIGRVDLMLWVLDPQKYADAAVHRQYLMPLAGHSEVMAVVLNQSDLLSADEIEDCKNDLRRLLDSEGLHDAAIIVTSAATGAGMDQLRTLLADAVSERRAATARISADVDAVVADFAAFEAERPAGAADGDSDPAAASVLAGTVPASSAEELVDAFCRAAGVSAVADAVQSARELRAVDYLGWPVAWLAQRVTGRDPVRRIRLGRLWAELKSMTAGPSGAQQAEIDSALTRLADEICPSLPRPWSQTTRSAVRSRAEEIPAAIGAGVSAAMSESVPDESKVTPWWRLVGVLQGLLLGCVCVSLAWFVVLLVFGVFHAAGHVARLFGDVSLLPWVVIMIAAFLLLGWLTASGCMNLARAAATRERDLVQDTMRGKIAVIAREMVIIPAEQELAEHRRFRDELRVAVGA